MTDDIIGLESAGAEAEASSAVEPLSAVAKCASGWIEIQLLGMDDKGVADERYRVTMPDGQVREGKTDAEGIVRIDWIVEGQCRICFPNLDADAWDQA